MATYSISAPDGKTYEITGPAGATQEQVQSEVLRQHPTAGTKAAAPTPPQSAFDGLVGTAKNLYGSYMEPAAAMVSGAVAKPVSDLAGLGQIANNSLGIGDPQDPAAIKAATQNAMTYEPRTDAGKAALGVLGKVGRIIGKGAEAIGQSGADDARLLGADQGTQDVVRSGASEFYNQVPALLGTKLPELGASRVASAGQDAIAAAPRQAALQAAKDAGYVIPPSEMINAPVGKALTGVAGKEQINRGFSLANQKVTDGIAAKDLGVPSNVPFDQAAVAKVKSNANAVYEAARKADQTQIPQKSTNGLTITGPTGAPLTKPAGPVVTDPAYAADVKNIGADRVNPDFATPIDKAVQDLQATLTKPTMSTSGLISKVTELREDARTNLNTIDDTAKKNLGRAQQQAADALEAQLDRYLQATGQPGMYSALKQARTTLAKAKTIEEAMSADGRIDAAHINNYRNNGGYVDGGLKTIADAADTIGNVVKNTSKVNAPEPFSKMQFLASLGGLSAGGGQAFGHTGAVAGGAAGTLMAGPSVARGILGSRAYQATLGGQTPTADILSRLAAQPASLFAGLVRTPQQGSDQ